MDGFWETVDRHGLEPNPYRAGFLQFVGVADSDAEAEELYAEHALYFYNRCLHLYPGFAEPARLHQHRHDPPGHRRPGRTRRPTAARVARPDVEGHRRARLRRRRQPDTVVDQLNEMADTLNVGHLMVLLHFGNMSQGDGHVQHPPLRRGRDAAAARPLRRVERQTGGPTR